MTVVAVDAGDIALLLAAAFFGLIAVVLSVVLANLYRVVTSIKDLVDGIRSETVPLINEINGTVKGVNREMERVDAIAAGVQGIVGNVESLTRTIHATVTSPLVKALAFMVGTQRASRKVRGKD